MTGENHEQDHLHADAPQHSDSCCRAELNKECVEPCINDEVKEYKDKYLRLLAETENTRKRLQKEKQDSVRYAVDHVMSDILVPMDNLENALKFTEKMSEETRNWALGFQMILSQFKEVLHQQGVQPFTSEGTLFDPRRHEAVEIEETEEKPEGLILQEFVKGYQSGDRIIRPARVKVAKKPSNNH